MFFVRRTPPGLSGGSVGGTTAVLLLCSRIPRDGHWYRIEFPFSQTSSMADHAKARARAEYPEGEFITRKEDGHRWVYVRFPVEVEDA